ncbi:tetratricopeptide repeat family protein [Collimonas arenae]|uniref:Tetratricopeptide repeat family protein n=2 Tax=Collimonas arenae TaxID=279058 RepID=A0A127QKL8_9BURK|nr:tetratricopeptide repeat family protein [Collimonas arenae]AMP10601.1 tetratricopeptide repeat family protein [Collimonas arenae]
MSGCATVVETPAATGQMTDAEMQMLMFRADSAINGGQISAAEQLYSKVVAAYPNDASVWFRIGTAYLRADQAELAVVALREALRIDPTMEKAWPNLAIAHLSQFRFAANKALASKQLSESNRVTLKSLQADVAHAIAPAPEPTKPESLATH